MIVLSPVSANRPASDIGSSRRVARRFVVSKIEWPRERKRVDWSNYPGLQREPRRLTAAAGSRSAMVATISRQVATDRKSSHSPCPAAVQNQEKGAAVDSVARRTRH